MAQITSEVIQILRATARQLEKSTVYQWGHMGSCNCGFLAQQITHLNKAEIHKRAMVRYGDWNEQLNDYCPTSGLPFDDIIHELLNAGFAIEDLKHLEKLSDPAILDQSPKGRFLRHNIKEDVVLYLNTWAAIIEMKLVSQIDLPQVFKSVEPVPAE
jgi:hypothetical protein